MGKAKNIKVVVDHLKRVEALLGKAKTDIKASKDSNPDLYKLVNVLQLQAQASHTEIEAGHASKKKTP